MPDAESSCGEMRRKAPLLHGESSPALTHVASSWPLLLQHKQVRSTSSWKWNPASQICTQISFCPAGNRAGEFAAPGGAIPVRGGWGRPGVEHTALNGILGYLTLSLFWPHLFTSQRNLSIFLCSSSQCSLKSFSLYSWSQKHPNLLPSHSSLTIISTCFPIFSFFKALIQTGFFLSLTCLHHHYFSPLSEVPLPIKNLVSIQLFKLILLH